LVGAVVVKNGEIIGEGWHTKFGNPHAEVEAIRNAGETSFKNTILYVNLEPCVHFGKTPPCADLIIEKGFSKVVIGMVDPNPLVSGKGVDKLRSVGIEVVTGILEDECRWLNRFFIKHIVKKQPYVMLKVAQSLDGCIATAGGQSQWITGEDSRRHTHQLRSEYDAVIVGRLTAELDKPRLDVRLVEGRNPKRIILDTQLILEIKSNDLPHDLLINTIIVCNEDMALSDKSKKLQELGVNILSNPLDKDNKIDLSVMLFDLYKKYNIGSIMVEGGAKIFSSFATAGLVDEMKLFIAPMLLGSGKHSFGDFRVDQIANAMKFKFRSIEWSGEDIYVTCTK
jgi:diaminohydroxyphosphoribosylaminopyrimidine deaminase/5-amino-6-(5-phosphoribosylamino)uracil reductase